MGRCRPCGECAGGGRDRVASEVPALVQSTLDTPAILIAVMMISALGVAPDLPVLGLEHLCISRDASMQ